MISALGTMNMAIEIQPKWWFRISFNQIEGPAGRESINRNHPLESMNKSVGWMD